MKWEGVVLCVSFPPSSNLLRREKFLFPFIYLSKKQKNRMGNLQCRMLLSLGRRPSTRPVFWNQLSPKTEQNWLSVNCSGRIMRCIRVNDAKCRCWWLRTICASLESRWDEKPFRSNCFSLLKNGEPAKGNRRRITITDNNCQYICLFYAGVAFSQWHSNQSKRREKLTQS